MQYSLLKLLHLFCLLRTAYMQNIPQNVQAVWLPPANGYVTCDVVAGTGNVQYSTTFTSNNKTPTVTAGPVTLLPLPVTNVVECTTYNVTMFVAIGSTTYPTSTPFVLATVSVPPMPTNFNVSAVDGSTAVDVKWTTVSTPPAGCSTIYRVKFEEESNMFEYIVRSGTSFRTPDLKAKTKYMVSMAAFSLPGGVVGPYTMKMEVTTNMSRRFSAGSLSMVLALLFLMNSQKEFW